MSSEIAVQVDLANPGQYFACCGMFEFAHRMWPGVEAWFDGDVFRMRGRGASQELVAALKACTIANVMTDGQERRRQELSAMGQAALKTDPKLDSEKKELDGLWRESPVTFGEPFGMRVDWFLDNRSGGKSFKTWAGQQSIVKLVMDLRAAMPPPDGEAWFLTASPGDCVPLNFDSNLGGAGADIDIGFSFDPLKALGLRVRICPAVELLAFAGLQRFRPSVSDHAWQYGVWTRPAPIELAALACCSAVPRLAEKRCRFELMRRTKYLKSFLPGRPL